MERAAPDHACVPDPLRGDGRVARGAASRREESVSDEVHVDVLGDRIRANQDDLAVGVALPDFGEVAAVVRGSPRISGMRNFSERGAMAGDVPLLLGDRKGLHETADLFLLAPQDQVAEQGDSTGSHAQGPREPTRVARAR